MKIRKDIWKYIKFNSYNLNNITNKVFWIVKLYLFKNISSYYVCLNIDKNVLFLYYM